MVLRPSDVAKRVTIFVAQGPHEHTAPYLRVLQILKEEGAAGATAIRALAAFGAREQVQTVRLAEIVPDLPVMIIWIDTAERVERILPHIRPLVTEGLITVDDTTIVHAAANTLPVLPKAVAVSEVMTRNVLTAYPDTPLRDLVLQLIGRRLHAAPVADRTRQVVGIVTVGDLLLKGGLPIPPQILRTFDTPEFHQELMRLARLRPDVRDVMSAPAITVHLSADVRQAADLMCRRNILRLPVVDADGRLVGIVSRADLVRAVAGGPTERALHFPRPPRVDGTSPIASIMSREVPTVLPEATLPEVAAQVVSTPLNRAVVVDGQRQVLGIVSDAQLVERLVPHAHPGLLAELIHGLPFVHQRESERTGNIGRQAWSIMQTGVVVVRESEPIRNVLMRIIQQPQTVVPVTDAAGRLVGVVDRIDLLAVLVGEAQHEH